MRNRPLGSEWMEFRVMVLVDQTDRVILDGLRRRPNPQSADRLLRLRPRRRAESSAVRPSSEAETLRRDPQTTLLQAVSSGHSSRRPPASLQMATEQSPDST